MNLSINKKIMEKVELVSIALSPLIIFLLMCFVVFSLKSCQSDNGFRVEHGARMGGGGFTFDTTYAEGYVNGVFTKHFPDTTKKPIPQPKIVYHNYELKGSDSLFQILWLQVISPMDVTPRQLTALKSWIQTSIKTDTTGQ